MPASHASELIAMTALTWNGRRYEPADQFKPRLMPAQRRTVDRMVRSSPRQLAELSAENMAIALERRSREAGPPAGFTLAGLLGLGLISEAQVEKYGWSGDAPASEKTTSEGGYTPPEGAMAVEDLWVIPVQGNGRFPRYDIVDAKGERVLAGGTINGKANAEQKAREFIASRPAEPENGDQNDTLMGSSKLPAIVEVAGHQIQLAGIVAAAFEDYSVSLEGVADATAVWNDMAEDGEGGREEKLQAMIDLFAADPEQIAKRVPEANIVARPDPDAAEIDIEKLEQLIQISEADVEAMDEAGLIEWLKANDKVVVAGTPEDEVRAAAVKIRDEAVEAVKRLDTSTNPNGDASDAGHVQPGADQPA